MSPRERWIEFGATSEERELLRSGIAERPSAGARRAAKDHVFASLRTRAKPLPDVDREDFERTTRAAAIPVLKWVATLAAAAAVALCVTALRRHGETAAARAETLPDPVSIDAKPGEPAQEALPEPVRPAAEESGERTAPIEPPVRSAIPKSPRSPSTRSSAAGRRGDAAMAEPDLAEELGSLDRARSELHAGRPGAALSAIDEHQRRFHAGRFVQEALVLRVEALMATGDETAACAMAREFVERHPDSPHVARVRSRARSCAIP